MKEIKIEKGVPFDAVHQNTKYPFRAMKVGDSFEAPFNYPPNSLAASAGVRIGCKFVVRKTGDRRYRIWRTA